MIYNKQKLYMELHESFCWHVDFLNFIFTCIVPLNDIYVWCNTHNRFCDILCTIYLSILRVCLWKFTFEHA